MPMQAGNNVGITEDTWQLVANYDELADDFPAIVRVHNTGSAEVEILIPELYGIRDAVPSESVAGSKIAGGALKEYEHCSTDGKLRGLIRRVYARTASATTINVEIMSR